MEVFKIQTKELKLETTDNRAIIVPEGECFIKIGLEVQLLFISVMPFK